MYVKKEIVLVSTALRLQANEVLRRGNWICFRLGAREIPNASYSAQDKLQRPPCRHGYQQSNNLESQQEPTTLFLLFFIFCIYTHTELMMSLLYVGSGAWWPRYATPKMALFLKKLNYMPYLYDLLWFYEYLTLN